MDPVWGGGKGGAEARRPSPRSPAPPSPSPQSIWLGWPCDRHPPTLHPPCICNVGRCESLSGASPILFWLSFQLRYTHTHHRLLAQCSIPPAHTLRLKTCVAAACFSGGRLSLIQRGHAVPADLYQAQSHAATSLPFFILPGSGLACGLGVRSAQVVLRLFLILRSSLSLFPIRSLVARWF